jgi:hypothetical protein
MKTGKFNLKKLAEALQERCPFILFATISGLDEAGQPGWLNDPELSIFILPGMGAWHALEKTLPVLAVTDPGVFFDVTLLNRVDVVSRFRAIHGECVFVREEAQEEYKNFMRQAGLDYRLMRARARRAGVIDND